MIVATRKKKQERYKEKMTSRAMHKVVGTVVTDEKNTATHVHQESSQASTRALGSSTIFGTTAEDDEYHPSNLKEVTSEAVFAAVKSSAPAETISALFARADRDQKDRDICSANDENGHSLAHWTAKRGDATLLAWVLRRGGRADAPSKDNVGMRPLHWACTVGKVACLRLLIDYGADCDARDKQGCTPLILASQWGQTEAAAYLVKIGADVRLLDRQSDSALHWASYKGNLEIVGLLHHLGLPIDEPDAYGQTPLHLAALCGNQSVCEYLLIDAPKPVRLEPRDKNGKTPLDLAKDKKKIRVATFLAAQRPLLKQSLKVFITERLTLSACVYWLLGESNPEAMRWPFLIMIFNKFIAHFFYFAYFLQVYSGKKLLSFFFSQLS